TSTEAVEKIELTLKPGLNAAAIRPEDAKNIRFFTEDGLVDSDKPQVITQKQDGSLVFTLPKTSYIVGDKPTKIAGVLLRPEGWERGGMLRCLRVETALVAAK
ncbi:MAG: hypothetical protein JWO94_825, partial [Verrucomicrobiaceae bacterium]|nr:hypothetical protein [Verrucomicrobiaceae bacterium]